MICRNDKKEILSMAEQNQEKKNEENRESCYWSTTIFQTPQKFKYVHVLTPIRLTRGSPSPLKRTPKRQRVNSIIVQYDSEYTYIITKKIQAVKQMMYWKCTVIIRIATCINSVFYLSSDRNKDPKK